jgi:hypothetical protein
MSTAVTPQQPPSLTRSLIRSHQPIKPEVAHEASLNDSLGAHLLTGLLPLDHDFGAINGGGHIKHLICHHFFSKMDAVEIT